MQNASGIKPRTQQSVWDRNGEPTFPHKKSTHGIFGKASPAPPVMPYSNRTVWGVVAVCATLTFSFCVWTLINDTAVQHLDFSTTKLLIRRFGEYVCVRVCVCVHVCGRGHAHFDCMHPIQITRVWMFAENLTRFTTRPSGVKITETSGPGSKAR